MSKRTYISLFSSAGIGCYGLKKENFECIVTAELLEPRLNIQKYNHKCKYDTGYIQGDITSNSIQQKIIDEIKYWEENEGILDVDVVIATPPCQGMSTANYKKNSEKKRNSLVVEAIKLVEKIKPKVFIFENVRAFMKTICTDIDGVDKEIKNVIYNTLSKYYNIDYRVINFSDYGVPSSRPRTLVIGTRKEMDYMSPLNLFPFPKDKKTFYNVTKDLKKIDEPYIYDENDVYHFFRNYPEYMREWIKDLKEGESAFNNEENKKPYKIVNGKKEILKSGHLGNKFRRIFWNKQAPCIATRSDQLAATDTIHPEYDRVLSIRELMRVMSIPDDFKWVNEKLNKEEIVEKRIEFLKKNELNIRRCIGEAVPTLIIQEIAKNLNDMLDFNESINKKINYNKNKKNIYIQGIISEEEHDEISAKQNGIFYTPQAVIFDNLNEIKYKQKKVRILEPSVGGGNFILPIISKFYNCEKIIIDVVDIDGHVLKNTMECLKKYNFPKDKIEINYIFGDFLKHDLKYYYDFVIGNPPYFKLKASQKKEYKKYLDFDCDDIFGLFLEKIYNNSENIIMILPKNFLMNPEFNSLREKYENYNIVTLYDYGVHAFKKVFIEIIGYFFTKKDISSTKVINVMEGVEYIHPQKYIFHDKVWLIYRNDFFDNYIKKLELDCFDFYRDRQITNKYLKTEGKIRVLRSKNIQNDGTIIDIENYDKYIDDISNFSITKFINKDNLIMPNFTYNTRVSKLPKNTIVNGSIAILIPKKEININKINLSTFSSKEFREYYSIVKNKSKFTINIDKNSIYYIGVLKNGNN